MVEARAQQQTLSIRISDALRDFLESAKQVIASGRGESVSTSDVAKMLLESAKDDRLDFRLEAAELQRVPTQSFCTIRRKLKNRQELSRAEWFFLTYYIQVGCEELPENPEMPTLGAFADLLRAILAVRELRTRSGISLDHYYLSNIGIPNLPQLNERQIDPHVVPEIFKKVIEQLEKGDASSRATFAGRIFNVAIRDEEVPNIIALNKALKPYVDPLFRLAARGHWIRERRPVRDDLDNERRTDDIPLFKVKGFRLDSTVDDNGEVMFLLDMEEKDTQYQLKEYPEIREFVTMLDRLEHCREWRGIFYRGGTVVPEDKEKPRRFYFRSRSEAVQIGFSVEEWHRLKKVFHMAVESGPVRRFFAELSQIYGEI